MNLRRFGIHADIAVNGKQALEKVAQRQYDLILMDVAMPEVCGLEATRAIRNHERLSGRRVPIVAVTASESREKCLSAGMDDYICKPPDYERVLRKWLPNFFVKVSNG